MGLMAGTADLLETDRTRARRAKERVTFDGELAYSVLDEAYVAHIGVATESGPVVLPMAYGRVEDRLYLHGAAANGLLRSGVEAEVCVTVTILDGLVMARSAFHHSMNFRCVVLRGRGRQVTDDTEKAAALDAIVDHAVPGRSGQARPANATELRKTLVMCVSIIEGSVKVRGHGAVDDPEDLDLPVWAGVIPLSVVFGKATQEPDQPAGLAVPEPGSGGRAEPA
ncbi:MAG: pyridoxamine 5'-phosphate oxidase family protein [Microthrixaceae bacterium]|nr:pyridoxamine 5'-phosphate oxidase family protein [Microthrixaceae bacterium]